MAKFDKPEPASPTLDAFELIFILLFLTGAAGMISNWISRYQESITSFLKALPYYLINFYAKYVVFSFFFSIFLFILVIIYIIRENEIRRKLMKRVLPAEGEVSMATESAVMQNPKWKLVSEHIDSNDANKWKLAIVEADIILSELLDTLNLSGDGVGEKLKNVETGDFEHIEEAWEAHKIRNAIAHEGSDFLLTQREAKRVIELYKSVFEEFEII
jgi:hypothetical protein